MNQYDPKYFWDKAASDPDVRYKYIADEWASTEMFLNLIIKENNFWNNVLEIGCGIGRLLVPLSKKYENCNFYGLDISNEMIKLAPKRNNIFYQQTVDNLDFIYSMLVFQHITHDDKVKYIKMSYDKLKVDGSIFFQFVVGNENSPYSYQTNKEEIENQLSIVGFKNIKFENHMHKDWLFVKATK